MDYSVNTRPLLEEEDEEREEEDESSDDVDVRVRGSTNSDDYFPKDLQPKDRFMLGYLTFYLLGIITLLPYTFFITANDYWMYKLRDTTMGSNMTSPTNKTVLQAEFTTYMTIAATGPSVFFLFVNSIFSHKISTTIRINVMLVIVLLCFILTSVLVEVDTDSWQSIFFAITLSTVVLVNVCGAIFQAGLLGIASKFNTRYVSAVVSGQAIGGVFPAIVYIFSLMVGASSTHCAMLYFSIANVTIATGLLSYYLLSRTIFFRYHMLLKAPANTLQYDPADSVNQAETVPANQIDLSAIFSKISHYGIAAMFCYIFTISVYPGVTVLVASTMPHSEWTDKYFVPTIAFLLFSICDWVGREVAGLLKWLMKRKWYIVVFSLIRIGFVPLILLCNAHPRHNLPVLITTDYGFTAIICLLGLTNGYVTNISLISIARSVGHGEQELASSVITTFISIGCALGAFLSYIAVKII